VLSRLRTELADNEVNIERGLALVMIVGEGMNHTIGLATRACAAFNKAEVNL